MTPELAAWVAARGPLVEDALRVSFRGGWASRLEEACRWPLFGGGKRLRPLLVLAAWEAVAGADARDPRAALVPACAVELLHTYSLVHDDLPQMDDDGERRGRPTTHVVYGEALALLAGDALLTEAFAVIADADRYGDVPPALPARLAVGLARAGGAAGMVGGQSLDLGHEGPVADAARLTLLHRQKTGALFRFCVWAGALVGGAAADRLERLARVGELLGLAFQVADDVLDAAQDAAPESVDPGTHTTPSFVALLGLEGARRHAFALAAEAREQLGDLGPEANPLRALCAWAAERDH